MPTITITKKEHNETHTRQSKERTFIVKPLFSRAEATVVSIECRNGRIRSTDGFVRQYSIPELAPRFCRSLSCIA